MGRDFATLWVHDDGRVDVITTVRGETRCEWTVPPDDVPAMLRDRRFSLRYAAWAEPRPRRG